MGSYPPQYRETFLMQEYISQRVGWLCFELIAYIGNKVPNLRLVRKGIQEQIQMFLELFLGDFIQVSDGFGKAVEKCWSKKLCSPWLWTACLPLSCGILYI